MCQPINQKLYRRYQELRLINSRVKAWRASKKNWNPTVQSIFSRICGLSRPVKSRWESYRRRMNCVCFTHARTQSLEFGGNSRMLGNMLGTLHRRTILLKGHLILLGLGTIRNSRSFRLVCSRLLSSSVAFVGSLEKILQNWVTSVSWMCSMTC